MFINCLLSVTREKIVDAFGCVESTNESLEIYDWEMKCGSMSVVCVNSKH